MPTPEPASARYRRMESSREPFLRRARDASRLTLPYLMPPLGHNAHRELPTPYQGVGAMGVTNLASKLLLSLFPPTEPFFRLVLSDPTVLDPLPGPIQAEIKESLVAHELLVQSEIELMALRSRLYEDIKHLIVAGNATLHVDGARARVIPLDQYVVARDPMGALELLIVREVVSAATLPPEAAEIVRRHQGKVLHSDDNTGTDIALRTEARDHDPVDIYTVVEWDAGALKGGGFRLHQEVADTPIPGSHQRVRPELMPFLVQRYSAIDGEDYGRGKIEEVMGDLLSLEGLMRAIIEASAATARLLFLVDPAGTATIDDLDSAPNGAFRVGRDGDITALQVNKLGDLQVTFAAVGRLEDRLQRAFLMSSSIQRNAERVTAEEIRYLAQELESALGGAFSVLSQELQLPIVQIVRDRLTRERKLSRLPKGIVRPTVVTGIEALGRGQELGKIATFAAAAQQIVGPDRLNQFIRVRELLGQLAAASGLDTEQLLRSEEEVAEENRQAQATQLATSGLGVKALDIAGPAIAQRMGLGAPEEGPPA